MFTIRLFWWHFKWMIERFSMTFGWLRILWKAIQLKKNEFKRALATFLLNFNYIQMKLIRCWTQSKKKPFKKTKREKNICINREIVVNDDHKIIQRHFHKAYNWAAGFMRLLRLNRKKWGKYKSDWPQMNCRKWFCWQLK